MRNSLDTGSSDIWVESATSSLCKQSSDPCQLTGTFDFRDSSTYSQVSTDFSISYVDGEYARGDYGKDIFTFADGTNVEGLQFGIGLSSSSTEGIMGIGFDLNEVQVQRLDKDPYRNLVDMMVDQKLIKSRAYSLWLNDLGKPFIKFHYSSITCQARVLMGYSQTPRRARYFSGVWIQPSLKETSSPFQSTKEKEKLTPASSQSR